MAQNIRIGLLSPGTADRPHFESLQQMLPPEVSLSHEGLGLLQNSYDDLAGKTDEIVARAVDFVRRSKVQGLIVTGGFVTLFNPGLEAKVAQAVLVPVTSAVSSVTAALAALSVERVLLVTPFAADMNAVIAKHLNSLGFTVFAGPRFDKDRKPGAGVNIGPEDLLRQVVENFRQNSTAEAFYFQGATLDPLPIMQQLEDASRVPVIASNPVMFWNILSKMGFKFSIKGYGKLLSSWPELKQAAL